MSGRRRARLLFGFLLAAVVVACSSGGGPGDTGASRGGRFVYPLRTDPLTLNFVSASDQTSDMIARLVGDSLVDRDADLRVVPRLAESWSFSEDGRVLTFHLRRGVRFHDGTPFTSTDVRYTYERVIDPKSRALGRLDGFLPIERLDTPDDATVRVLYRHPYAPALAAWETPILPRHLYEKEDFLTSPHNRAPVGTGPFRFVSWETGRSLLLEANADYWGGRPALDGILMPIIPSQETTLQALLAGEVDYASLTPVQLRAHQAERSFDSRFRVLRSLSLFVYYIAWRGDGSNPFFADPSVRRALSLAIDRDEYVRTVLHGAGRPAGSIFHPLILPDTAGDTANDAPRADPAAAAALLDAAGWLRDPRTGLRSRHGIPFRFTLLIFSGGEDHVQFSQVAQESLRRLGVEMSIVALDWPTLYARLQKGDFQAALSGTVPNGDPDDVVYAMLHSSQIKDGRNYAAFRDPRVDAWLEEGRRTLDPAARVAVYRDLERRVLELQPYTWLFFPMVQAALSRRVDGAVPSPRGLFVQYPGPLRLRLLAKTGG